MSDPAPLPPEHGSRGVVFYINRLILATPFAALAAGPGAFLGMSVAYAGWGNERLGMGAAIGAAVGAMLVGVWMLVLVARVRGSQEDHAKKVAHFVKDMEGRGIPSHATTPILFRLLWMMGLQVPPPLFLGFWSKFLWSAGVFGAMTGAACAVCWWRQPNTPWWIIWLTGLLFLSAVLGVCAYNAAATASELRKLQLPSWDRYAPPPEPDASAATGAASNER